MLMPRKLFPTGNSRCAKTTTLTRPTVLRARKRVRAASFLPDDLEDFISLGTVVASGAAIVGTAALAVRSKKQPGKDTEGFGYGVMGLVSCIPLFNWTAWVLPALQDPDRAALYYSYALLYASPLLLEGFDIEEYTIIMLLLGIVHVQVERIAATEPDTFRQAKPLAAVLNVAGVIAEQAVRFTTSLVGIVAKDTQQVIQGPGRDNGTLADPERSKDDDVLPVIPGPDQELQEFDRMLMEREAKKRAQRKDGRSSRS